MSLIPAGYTTFRPESKVSFEMTAMIQEWHDFLLSQCGYDEPDHELVARLADRNARVFGDMLLDEVSMLWEPLLGIFAVETKVFLANGAKPPLRLDEIDLMWADCFQQVSDDWFDRIEEGLHEERERGLTA